MKIHPYYLIILLFIFARCKKDEVAPDPIEVVPVQSTALIINEGNFQWGNASLTRINLITSEINQDVFFQANQRPLGDVFQSMLLVGDDLWLLVYNSQKIERVNKSSFIAKPPITSLQSPRYMLQFANTVYISDLYANQIHRVNASSGETLPAIPFPGWSEGIILDSNDKIWVSNATHGKVMKIDPTSNHIIDSIAVGDVPRDLKLDNQGNVWVLCEGKTFPNESAGSLWCFNPSTHAIVQSFQFSSNAHPSRLISIQETGELLFLKNGVCKFKTADSTINETPFIAQNSKLFYGLGYNSFDSTIWVSDAKDFQQSGDALVFKASDGAFIKSYSVGIIPSSFYFY